VALLIQAQQILPVTLLGVARSRRSSSSRAQSVRTADAGELPRASAVADPAQAGCREIDGCGRWPAPPRGSANYEGPPEGAGGP
jgi:hypothetical protein